MRIEFGSQTAKAALVVGGIIGAAATAAGIVGQLFAALIFLGANFVATTDNWIGVLTGLWLASFAALTVVFVRSRAKRLSDLWGGAPTPLPRFIHLLFIYWLLSFASLLVLTGDAKGVVQEGSHYFVKHFNARSEVPRSEYLRQAAYPLWMLSAASLAYGMALTGYVLKRRSQ